MSTQPANPFARGSKNWETAYQLLLLLMKQLSVCAPAVTFNRISGALLSIFIFAGTKNHSVAGAGDCFCAPYNVERQILLPVFSVDARVAVVFLWIFLSFFLNFTYYFFIFIADLCQNNNNKQRNIVFSKIFHLVFKKRSFLLKVMWWFCSKNYLLSIMEEKRLTKFRNSNYVMLSQITSDSLKLTLSPIGKSTEASNCLINSQVLYSPY